MAADRELPDRRTVLMGGGIVVLAVAAGAWIVEARDDDESPGSSGDGADQPSTTRSATSTVAPTTSVSPTTSVAPVLPEQVAPGVLAIGSAYLSERPGEADLATLLSRLPSPDGDVVAAARSAISSEFGRGDTVVLDGWVLAASEARAAAVLALCADAC